MRVISLVTLAGIVAITTEAQRVRLHPDVHRELLLSGRPQIGLWRALLKDAEAKAESELGVTDLARTSQHPFKSSSFAPKFKAYCHDQPISHFSSEPNGTFCQRYWMDASSYQSGGPVFVLDGGETSGEDRLPFLETGILQILSNATGGLSIVLEHRYYGESLPVSTLSTDDLRFLNNAEAMADSAHFIENFNPPKSLLNLDNPSALHPNSTPWIYYGGSYAGARAAHMRTQYPDLVWGAIASSAVTHAQINFPEYYDPIQKYAPEECISALQSAVIAVDKLLDLPEPVPTGLKSLFGLGQLSDQADFADVISSPLGSWQAKNWDPAVGSDAFADFCEALTAGKAGSQIGLIRIPAVVVNYATYIRENIVSRCPRSDGEPASDIEDCFGSQDDSKFRETGLDQTWRLWLFQVCTQWGYFMPAPLSGPSIISNRITLEQTSKICRQAFPPGEKFVVPPLPDVEEVNRRGDYGIAMDRLAFIDGDRDPWRPMTPQSDFAPRRSSSVSRPVHMIFDGVHHYDENGLADHDLEPARIRDVHELEKEFIKEWLVEWKESRKVR